MISKISLTALFSFLMVVGAYIQITVPGSPLPVILSHFFMMLAGLLLGSVWGFASVMIYLLLGALGVPVFADGTGGMHHFTDFKAGYPLGYALSVFIVGKISEKGQAGMLRDFIALSVGGIVALGSGMVWLKFALNISWYISFISGVLPLLPGAFGQAGLAVLLIRYLRPFVKANL